MRSLAPVAAGSFLTWTKAREQGRDSTASFRTHSVPSESPDWFFEDTPSRERTARIWDVADLSTGDAFSIACRQLGNDINLADVQERYGLGEIAPICSANAPLPVDVRKLQ
jgi:hypothetical protein